MFGRRKRSTHNSGCLFVLMQGLVIAGLLFLNGILVRAFILANPGFDDIRVVQAVQFVIPLIMIFFELWIYDFLTARTSEDGAE